MLHTRSCNSVKFQALVVTRECFKCDELSRPLCQMQLNFDVFDHFLKVKVPEIFWGAPAPPSPLLGGFAPQIPQRQGPRSKKPCASVDNVGPGRLRESGPKGPASSLCIHKTSQESTVVAEAFNVAAVIVNDPLTSLPQK